MKWDKLAKLYDKQNATPFFSELVSQKSIAGVDILLLFLFLINLLKILKNYCTMSVFYGRIMER